MYLSVYIMNHSTVFHIAKKHPNRFSSNDAKYSLNVSFNLFNSTIQHVAILLELIYELQ